MTFGILDFIRLIGALGLFLYGMKIMSEGLQKISGDKMRNILSAMTSNRFFGVLTGITITALIQSSSATTLMVVSFVNAGLLSLAQSISVVMGANIGTTVTAWIISLLGFKVDISAFAIPLFAFAIPLIFSKKSKWNNIGEFVIGFSLLFLGLEFLKSSMPDLQSNPEALEFLSAYSDLGFASVLIFLLIGTVMTIIVQSSSATVAITLIMCYNGWIPFELALAMVLGENIGTTITANLAAFNANVAAKRTAFSHFLFNFLGVVWVLCLFYPLAHLVKDLSGENPSVGLALFHSLFNIANALLMIWFVPIYVKICERVIRSPKTSSFGEDEDRHLQFISTRMLSTSELSLIQVHKELGSYSNRVLEMLQMDRVLISTTDSTEFNNTFNRIEKFENICDRVEVEIVNYLNALSDGDLSSDAKQEGRVMMRAATEIERLGDTCFNIARSLKKRNSSNTSFEPLLVENLLALHEVVLKSALHMIEVLQMSNPGADAAHQSYNIENEIDNMRDDLKQKNMQDLDNHVYPYQQSVYYLDIIDEYEHFGDYALNVVQAIVEKKV